MTSAALLVTALLFGGMTLYSFGFAAFVFSALPAQAAGPLIRKAFPWFYLFVMATSAVAAALAASGDTVSALVLAAIAATTVFARQVLHSFSVLITLGHIAGAGLALLRLANS